jgi:hypothetical protein
MKRTMKKTPFIPLYERGRAKNNTQYVKYLNPQLKVGGTI